MRTPSLLCALLLAGVSTPAHALDFTGPLAPNQWASSGILAGTASVDLANSDAVHLTAVYDVTLGGSNGVPYRTAQFTAVPDADGLVSFDWTYTYEHAWYQVNADLIFFYVDSAGTRHDLQVVDSTQGGGQFLFGTVTDLPVFAGRPFGFEVGGSNYDSYAHLGGTVVLGPHDVDCAGTWSGDAEEDACGTCDDDPANDCVQDCAGEWGGDAVEDACGTCDDDPANDCVQDCAGEWGGDAVEDACGTCDDDPANDCVQDCAGEWGGDAVEDACGTCDDDPTNDCVVDTGDTGETGDTAVPGPDDTGTPAPTEEPVDTGPGALPTAIDGGCGCTSSTRASAGLWLLGLGVLGLGRRRG